MRALFKILSFARWMKAASQGKLLPRYARIRSIRAINRHIR